MMRVVVGGCAGQLGRLAAKAIAEEGSLSWVAGVSPRHAGQDGRTLIGGGPEGHPEVPLFGGVPAAAQGVQAELYLDLSTPGTALANALSAVGAGWAPVVGTSGLGKEAQASLDAALRLGGLPGLLVPNFAIGAILMMRFAAEAARWLPAAELVELHHDRKRDAPSGTAVGTVQAMAQAAAGRGLGAGHPEEHETWPGARGAVGPGGIRVHSIRLPGLLAHQEVLCSGPGQLLTLRHDAFDRQAYLPGILLALKGLRRLAPGLHLGLEAVMEPS